MTFVPEFAAQTVPENTEELLLSSINMGYVHSSEKKVDNHTNKIKR